MHVQLTGSDKRLVIQPAAMITQSFPVQEAQEAFALIENDPGSTIKVQLTFGD